MSNTRDPRDHGGPKDPEYRIGRGPRARRRIAGLAVGVVVFVLAVLLVIWFLGREAADVDGAAAWGAALGAW